MRWSRLSGSAANDSDAKTSRTASMYFIGGIGSFAASYPPTRAVSLPKKRGLLRHFQPDLPLLEHGNFNTDGKVIVLFDAGELDQALSRLARIGSPFCSIVVPAAMGIRKLQELSSLRLMIFGIIESFTQATSTLPPLSLSNIRRGPISVRFLNSRGPQKLPVNPAPELSPRSFEKKLNAIHSEARDLSDSADCQPIHRSLDRMWRGVLLEIEALDRQSVGAERAGGNARGIYEIDRRDSRPCGGVQCEALEQRRSIR